MTTEKLDPAHTLNAPFGFTDREKSAWSYGYREGHAAALASSPQPAEPAEKESQCTNGTLNTWQSQLDTAASGATPTRDATSAALAAPASSIQAGNSPESGSIQAEVPPGPFDHLAGRGLHELRFDELTPYVLTILEDPAAVEAAVAWIVSELTRKTNDERILAVQLAALREAASPPSAPVEAPKLHARTADLVQRFSKALAEKLADAERKYGYADGWADNDWMDNCRESLMEHIVKGDPRDVAAYCAFLWHHGESTTIKRRRPCPFCVGRTGMVSSTCEDCLGSGELPVSTSPSAPAQVPGWQSIETAPKDGTHVLIANDAPGSVHPREGYYVAPEHRYENEPTHAGWWRLAGSSEERVHGRTPTHWQPLPPPPVSAPTVGKIETHKLDTASQVFFYEQDFYVLSNFSAFNLEWAGMEFPTSEHAYHWEKFACSELGLPGGRSDIAYLVATAPSAHEAFKIAERNKEKRRPDWDAVKVKIMRDILRAKAEQHEYVRRKLLATGDRELVEDSWRDDFWGWGPNRNGQNMLGRLWMEVRAELRAAGEGKAG